MHAQGVGAIFEVIGDRTVLEGSSQAYEQEQSRCSFCKQRSAEQEASGFGCNYLGCATVLEFFCKTVYCIIECLGAFENGGNVKDMIPSLG